MILFLILACIALSLFAGFINLVKAGTHPATAVLLLALVGGTPFGIIGLCRVLR